MNGDVSAANEVALEAANAGHTLLLRARVTGDTVSLVSYGKLSENSTSGHISADTLEGSSGGNTVLGGKNNVETLKNFRTDGGKLVFVDGRPVNISGTARNRAALGTVHVKTTNGNLRISDGATVRGTYRHAYLCPQGC